MHHHTADKLPLNVRQPTQTFEGFFKREFWSLNEESLLNKSKLDFSSNHQRYETKRLQ